MAERTVAVTLTAVVTGYIAGMDKAAQATKKSSQTAEQSLAKQRDAMQKVGAAALAMGAVAAAGVAYAVKTFAEFDAKMSQVQALSHATADEMDQLRTAALNMGQGIGFSASQVADAETELVKAGISVSDILGGALQGALTLAAAGQIDVADATEIATIAMTQFSLKGKDIPHVADLLSAGADKALGGVQDLGEALKSGGLVASQFGVSLDETVGVLSAFANAGLIGETAGTDLRQMLLKLGAPSAEAAKTMKDLGISIYDANGQFVGLSNLAGQLHDKMGSLDQATRNTALATIFGSRAIAGANVLYKEGAKGISEWTSEVNDQGFAAEQAAAKMNNLEGDVKKLGAAFESDIIKSGSGANDVLRGMTQGLTSLLQGVGGLPQPLLTVGLAVTGLVAGVGLLGGGFLTLVPRIAATRTAMNDLGLTGRSVLKYFGKGGLVMLGITALASGLAGANEQAELTAEQLAKVNSAFKGTNVDVFTKQLDNMSGSTNTLGEKLNYLYSGDFLQSGRGAQGLASAIDTLTFGATKFSNVFKTSEAQFTAYGKALGALAQTDLPKASSKFSDFVKAAGGGKEAIRQATEAMPDYAAAITELATAQGITLTQQQLWDVEMGKGKIADKLQAAARATADNTTALSDMTGQAQDADGAISDLAQTLSDFGKGALDVSSATIAFHQSIDDASAAIEKNGATLDLSTQAGRDNQRALDDIASSTTALVSAQATAGASSDTLTASMATGRQAFIDAATAAGLTADQANALANQYGLIPANVNTAIGITGVGPTLQQIQDVKNQIAGIDRNIDIAIKLHGAENLATSGGLRIVNAEGSITDYYANGGMRERHIAQIAPAGAMRIWAEPETGGEAYIPLAPSKRERSLSIWQATGRRLGVQGFANGGVTYVSAPPQYMTAPSTAGSFPKGMVLVGTLDLGNGLEGRMKAVVADAFDADAAVHTRGFGGY